MVDTTIYIGGFAIHEPVTVLTDYIITVLAFIYFLKIKPTNAISRNWRLFFLFLSVSTLFGGTAHALFAVHEGPAYKSVWLTMQIINGLAVYFAQHATLVSVLKDSPNKKLWKYSYIIQLLVYYIVLLIVQKYVVTIVDNALGLITIMVLHLTARKKEEYQKFIAYGILISFITAIVHGAKLSIHDYFNYNDIAHVFIMISLSVMVKGAQMAALLTEVG